MTQICIATPFLLYIPSTSWPLLKPQFLYNGPEVYRVAKVVNFAGNLSMCALRKKREGGMKRQQEL